MSFLYYIPGAPLLTAENKDRIYADCGLLSALRGCDFSSRQIVHGPDGSGGIVLAAAPRMTQNDPSPTYSKDAQTWHACNGGAYWIGMTKGEKIAPESLARSEQIDGYLPVLGDGNKWVIPTARAIDGTEKLPQSVRWGIDGRPIREMMPQYVEFSARCARVADSVYVGGAMPTATDDNIEIAADAIALNYHVSKYEVGLLGLLAPVDAMTRLIILCLIDFPSYESWHGALGNAESPAASAGDNG